MIKRCKNCIMPESEEHILINDKGICNICSQEQKNEQSNKKFNNINSEDKIRILIQKVKKFKTGAKYDCAVALSGGKDSVMALHIAKKILNLNPLAIFIDNGFALPEMYNNVNNVTNILEVDLIQHKCSDMKKLFKIFLESGRHIYYCRPCHILLDYLINDICEKYGIHLVLGGYTKGQNYTNIPELTWIYKESDSNIIDVLKNTNYENYIEIFKNPVSYFSNHYRNILYVSPFKYLDYNEEKIIKFISEQYNFKLPQHSWPLKSANCSFNFVSQYLAQKFFGYSQHETELSKLIREREITREQALSICFPISKTDLFQPLKNLDINIESII